MYVSFFQTSTAHEIISHFEGEHADLVVCDGAPDGNGLLSGVQIRGGSLDNSKIFFLISQGKHIL